MTSKVQLKKEKKKSVLSQSSWDVQKEQKELCVLCFKDI